MLILICCYWSSSGFNQQMAANIPTVHWQTDRVNKSQCVIIQTDDYKQFHFQQTSFRKEKFIINLLFIFILSWQCLLKSLYIKINVSIILCYHHIRGCIIGRGEMRSRSWSSLNPLKLSRNDLKDQMAIVKVHSFGLNLIRLKVAEDKTEYFVVRIKQ